MSEIVSNSIPPEIRRFIGEFETRRRRMRCLRAIALAATFAIVFLMLGSLFDRLIPLAPQVRAMLLTINLLGFGLVLFRPIRALLRRRIDWLNAAVRIESRRPIFAERLITVVSQLQSSETLRGSTGMLEQLSGQVRNQVIAEHGGRLVSARRVVRAYGLLLVAMIVLIALSFNSWLDLRTLVARQLKPLAPIAPVTTTRLSVHPGDHDLIAGESIAIDVRATRMGDARPLLHRSSDGVSWQSAPMSAIAGDRYVTELENVNRDEHYYVTGGDARSTTYLIRAMRKPGIAGFAFKIVCPDYVHRATEGITNTDGVVEAPAGSDATMTIESTEPLQSARTRVGSNAIVMQRIDATHWQAVLPIHESHPMDIQLMSERGQRGTGPATARIRAIADLPPVARLLVPQDATRAAPGAIVSIPYYAADDYAIESLKLSASLNGKPATELPISVVPETKTQNDAIRLATAAFGGAPGDVLTVTLIARDHAGQVTRSEPIRILVASHTNDLEDAQRIADLREGARLGAKLEEAIAIAAHGDAPAAAIKSQIESARQLAGRISDIAMHALAHSDSSGVSNAMTDAVDRATTLFHASDAAMISNDAINSSRAVYLNFRVIADAERAQSLLNDRADLRAAIGVLPRAGRAQFQALRGLLDESSRRMQAEMVELGLNPYDPQIDQQLTQKAKEASDLCAAIHAPDFVQGARDWAVAPAGHPVYVPRVAAGSQAQAVRRDGDAVWARDLRIAARATKAIESDADSRHQFGDLLLAMQREHEVDHRAPEFASVHELAEKARATMRGWADRDEVARRSQAKDDTAFDSAAAAARKEFDKAKVLDQTASESLENAEKADQLAKKQRQIESQTPQAKDPSRIRDAQRALSKEIDELRKQEAESDARKSQSTNNTKKEPLQSAKESSDRAADAMQSPLQSPLTPTDPQKKKAVAEHQQAASKALDQAVDDLAKRAAGERLGSVPALARFFHPRVGGVDGTMPFSAENAGNADAPLQGWGTLHPRDAIDQNAAARESDPPGYSDALRVYFKALSRTGK